MLRQTFVLKLHQLWHHLLVEEELESVKLHVEKEKMGTKSQENTKSVK
jgi:hypothetical protein